MRLFATLFLFLLFFGAVAQTSIPRFNSYSDRFYYVDKLNVALVPMAPQQLNDTLKILTKKAENNGDAELAGMLKLLLYRFGMYSHYLGADSAEHGIEAIIAYAADNGLHYLEADALQTAGEFHTEFRNRHSTAMENYIAAYKIYSHFSPDEYPRKQENIYVLGSAYYSYEDYENAIKYLQEALSTVPARGHNIYYTTNNTIGLSFRNMGKYDSALWYFQKIYDSVSKDANEKTWRHIAGGNIGITYFKQKKYSEAIPLLDDDIETSIAHTQIKNAASSMTTRAAIYYYQGDYTKAERMLHKALDLCESKPFWPDYQLAEQMYTWLSKVYAAKNNMTSAYRFADSALMAKDSVNARLNLLTLAKANERTNYVQRKLDEEKLNERIKIDQLALSKKRVEATFFFIGIVVLLLVIIFIARERKRSENILLNILPEKIAERLKNREHPIADYFENASILFIDMAGFTSFSDNRDPKDVVNILNHIFTSFDVLADKHGLEKIKTIGDCYMAVSGLPEPNPHHAEAAADMALEIKAEMNKYTADDGTPITFRMGLDCGPVVAGVIGRRKFIYDLWGDTVNTASRMETTGIAGEIHCSERFKKQLEHKYHFTSRGSIEVKGKGLMETWLLV